MSILGKLQDGTPVFNMANGHVESHSGAMVTIKEALSKVSFNITDGLFQIHTVKVSTEGLSFCIKTTEADEASIYWAKRAPRENLSRMISGKEPEKTHDFTVMLQIIQGTLYLVTGFYGASAPKEPTDPTLAPEEASESFKFWANHALITQ